MGYRLLGRSAALAFAAAALIVASPAGAVPAVDGEFEVSSVDSNTKIATGPDGNIWLTLAFNAAGNDVARVTPTGEVKEYELEVANPLGVTAGPDGNVWITQNGGVTKFSPADPEGSKQKIEENKIIGNHAIVTGPDGNLWVATDGHLVRIEPGSDTTKAFPVAGLVPKDIDVAGPLLAIASQEGIVTATAADPPVTTEYPIDGLASQGVAGSPGGQIAFSDPLASPEKIGLITPPNAAQENELDGDPFGVTFGSDGAFWIARFASGSITRLSTDGQMTDLGGFPTEGPRHITTGPGNTLWVTVETKEEGGEEKPDKVARVSGVDPPPSALPIAGTAPPETTILKGPKKRVKTKRKRARVRFKFTSPNAGAAFECALTKIRKGKAKGKAEKPRFKPCKSPKRYRLKPGRYRFWVRAVLGGVVDPTPAKRRFRIIRRR